MKFIRLTHLGEEIVVNKDAVAYVMSVDNETCLFFPVLDKDGRFKRIFVSESYEEVVVLLNS